MLVSPLLYSQCEATPASAMLVHVLGADLDFDRRAERAEQRGVQRLVAVRPWGWRCSP